MLHYDFMVEGRNKLWRVQVKTSSCMREHLYQLCVQRITHRRVVAYKKSELDFVVAYLVPERVWYVLPISVIAGRRSILLPPGDYLRKNSFAKSGTSWASRIAPRSAEPVWRGIPVRTFAVALPDGRQKDPYASANLNNAQGDSDKPLQFHREAEQRYLSVLEWYQERTGGPALQSYGARTNSLDMVTVGRNRCT